MSSDSPRVVIVGAGIGGLIFSIALKQRFPGYENFTIYEKASDVGGTWRDNTYPGCGSDIAVMYYSHSTTLKHNWTHSLAYQPQIQEYWQEMARKNDLYRKCVFNTCVIAADWDVDKELWVVVTKDLKTGTESTTIAKILVSALGFLELPHYPNINGLNKFIGDMFHSAKWDYGISLKNKRVAVIGNGASATQFVPVISEDPSTEIVEFCRTPYWVLWNLRNSYGPVWQFLLKWIPFNMLLHRYYHCVKMELGYLFIFGNDFLRDWFVKPFSTFYIKTFAPKEYHNKLIPTYKVGCRRLIFNSFYLESLHRPNMRLNWDGIDSIVEDGIITKKGEKFTFDVIILSTGFITDDYPLHVRGTEQSVKEYYASKGGPTAYRGTTVPGFPNFYIIGGPNTVTGHASVIFTEEVQANYAMTLVAPVIEGLVSSFTVKHQPADEWNAKIQARLARSVFPDCLSWYRSGKDGKVTSVFPGGAPLFWWWMRKTHFEHYDAVASQDWYKQLKREKRIKVTKLVVAGLSAVAFGAWLAHEFGRTGSILDVLNEVREGTVSKLGEIVSFMRS